ncbi:MAG: cytochrome P460 family protein [Hyphomicrobiaceae bacterium]
MKLHISMAATGFAAGFVALGATIALHAAGDKVAFPAVYDKGVLYAVVDRHDVKQYRELWATQAAVDAARKGEPIPSGTVLTLVQYKAKLEADGKPSKDANGRFLKGDLIAYAVMEKRTGWGTEYPDTLRNGEWEYQAFTTDKKVNEKANLKGCFECHKPHAGQDFVISLAGLKGTQPGAMAAPKPGPGVVGISDFLFGPEKVVIEKGKAVTWTNTDASPHQVTLKASGTRSPIILKGQSQALTFNDAGTFEYICGLHPNMKGTVEVK